MLASQRPQALHAALRFVITSDIPSEHKATLIDVLTQTLRNDRAAEEQQALAREHQPWQEHEILQIKSFLSDRVATSWQLADECVMHLVAQLHRDPRVIRDKAVELGLGASVDYRIAKTTRRE
jgi:hypothetical protein